MNRHWASFAWCGTGHYRRTAVRISFLLIGLTLGPEAVAAQGRLEARATVISASAAREGLALSDSVLRIDLVADTFTTARRVDGPLTSLFWYPAAARAERTLAPHPSPVRPDLTVPPRPRFARVARVLEIHYLRN